MYLLANNHHYKGRLFLLDCGMEYLQYSLQDLHDHLAKCNRFKHLFQNSNLDKSQFNTLS
jgi:hypothetical protein